MSSGHCEHCGPGCDSPSVYDGRWDHHRLVDKPLWDGRMVPHIVAQWWDGECPACAERKRIKSLLRDLFDDCRQDEEPGILAALDMLEADQ